jgi:beta-galactosidase
MTVFFGGDYNPEQWPEDVWREDIALMRRAGVTLATVGVFSWSSLQPSPDRFTFDWLDRVMDLLHDGGVRVALATPTASPPPWFSLAHPEALPVNRDGVRLSHGSRDTFCAAAPAYREAATRIAGELARRYAGHPALALWHVHNEYGTWCHCDLHARAFRDWLRKRHGSLDRLNEAWTTAFWGQGYRDWAEILPPRATQYLANPAHALDYRRFTSDLLLDCFREQRDVLRAANPAVPVTTNYVLGSWVPVEHWSWSAEVDLVAIDHYPSATDIGAEEETALAADTARGWAGGNSWLLMEQAPNLIYAGGRMHVKEPGRMARHSLAHVARGSRGAMFFQWRAPMGGAELFHSAMVPHAGPDSRVFREVCDLGRVLRHLAAADPGWIDAPVVADVAILADDEAWWATQADGLPARVDYPGALASVHRALWRQGMTADVVRPGAGLTSYRLVLVPSLYLVSDAAAEAVRAYVEAGGELAVWFFSGVADPAPRVRRGGHAFADLLGVRVEEFLPLPESESVALSTGDRGRCWSEAVDLVGADVAASYVDGVLDGRPAITRHRYGRGRAWYVSTTLDDDGLARFMARLAASAGVRPVVEGLPVGVEAVRRRAEDGRSWLFVINHTDGLGMVPAVGVDLVTGEPVTGRAVVGPGEFTVIREG